jgi:hypothetical protein
MIDGSRSSDPAAADGVIGFGGMNGTLRPDGCSALAAGAGDGAAAGAGAGRGAVAAGVSGCRKARDGSTRPGCDTGCGVGRDVGWGVG